MKIYEYTYGTAETEQDFVTYLDTFLVSTIGWTRIDTISDISSNRDYAWKSVGESPSEYTRNIFIRVRAESNNIYSYGYGSYSSGHEIYNASYTYVPTTGQPFRYWIYGDKDFVCFIILNGSDSQTYASYLGYIRSYYVPDTDPHPLLIRGQASSTYAWTSNSFSYMYGPTSSGVLKYDGYNQYTTTLSYDVQTRAAGITMLPVILYSANGGSYEVRGEPNGVYQTNGNFTGSVAPLTSASGVFLAFKSAGAVEKTYLYGPVASGIDSFDMF